MAINTKMLMDLAGELGIDDIKGAERKAAQFQDKSDDELLSEIASLKEVIKKDPAAFEKQLRAVHALRPMMTDKQKAQLDKIIRLLES